jgi:excisionase family DNA binding protein
VSIELKGLYSPKQAAAILGIHEKSIFRWLRDGKIVTTVIVAGQRLIPESEVERLNKERKEEAAKVANPSG